MEMRGTCSRIRFLGSLGPSCCHAPESKAAGVSYPGVTCWPSRARAWFSSSCPIREMEPPPLPPRPTATQVSCIGIMYRSASLLSPLVMVVRPNRAQEGATLGAPESGFECFRRNTLGSRSASETVQER